MPNFAVIENQKITNIIIAESKLIAEQVTGKTCIEYINEPAEVGGTYINGTFTQAPKIEPEILIEE